VQYFSDFWEYDSAENTWTKKADFAGVPMRSNIGFSIGDKGYIGIGATESGFTKEIWEYEPSSNKWTKKSSFKGIARHYVNSFSIGNKGYIIGGYDPDVNISPEVWEFDPEN
ncbi:MAG: galactose oxidase, partial [Bacteroidota bacterium]